MHDTATMARAADRFQVAGRAAPAAARAAPARLH
jgi:hypothetical protein